MRSEGMPCERWDASSIEWNEAPSMVVGAVLYKPNWPNRWAVLLAAAVLARNGLSRGSIRTASASFKRLALHLHERFGTNCWTEVTPTQWREVAQDEVSTATRTTWFEWYQAVSSFHVQEYLRAFRPRTRPPSPRMRGRACPLALWIGTSQPEWPTLRHNDGARPARTCSCPSRTSLPRWSCDGKRRRSGWSSTSPLPSPMWSGSTTAAGRDRVRRRDPRCEPRRRPCG